MTLGLAAFEAAAPKLQTVEPDAGKTGDTAAAKGENLGKTVVGELYFTDGKKDIKLAITGQSDTEIKFVVPKTLSGRYRLMTLSANKSSMVEQPVMFTIE